MQAGKMYPGREVVQRDRQHFS